MGILLNKSKNYIINGALDYFQRGDSFAAVADNAYIADRFAYRKTGTMVQTASQDLTDRPTLAQSGSIFPASLRLLLTTPQTTLSAGDFNHIGQRIEGQVIAPLQGKSVALSFWVKATLVGTYAVAIKNSALNRSYVSTYTVNATETWEKKTITFAFDASGVWLADTGIGMRLIFSVASGSTRRVSTLNAWVSGDFESHASCVNGVNTGATNFRIAGIQLEEGTTASGFERAGGNALNELQLCQRYFEKSYNISTNPGLAGNYQGAIQFLKAQVTTTNEFSIPTRFKVQKRVTPAVVPYAPGTGTANRVEAGGTDRISVVRSTGESGFDAGQAASQAAAANIYYQYTADAEL